MKKKKVLFRGSFSQTHISGGAFFFLSSNGGKMLNFLSGKWKTKNPAPYGLTNMSPQEKP